MIRLNLLLIAAVVCSLPCFSWSSNGHKITAYIAKRHLSAEAAAALDEILYGNSIVFYASWLDSASRTDEYAYTSTWHYVNVDEWQTYETRVIPHAGDAVTALYDMEEVLIRPDYSQEEKELAAKVIIHVVGDIHQPLHAGHASDKGGNYINVYFMGEKKTLHSVWDYDMVNSAHNWTYYEWQNNLDVQDDATNEAMAEGDFDDWARESVGVAADVYRAFTRGKQITREMVEEWTPTVETQLLRGGLRLAKTFNRIFSDESGVNLPCVVTDRKPFENSDYVYDINGRRLNRNSNLPAGIYITPAGQKLLIK